MKNETLVPIAKDAVRIAQKKGAKDAVASVSRNRTVSFAWRDGRVESVSEATSRELGMQLYVDGRYASVSTSDLRPEALERFVEEAIAMTRLLAPDPHRKLPDPSLWQNRVNADLQIFDTSRGTVDTTYRTRIAKALEDAVRADKRDAPILSVSTSFSDTESQYVLVSSGGFVGEREATSFSLGADVSVRDEDGRRPEDYAGANARHLHGLPSPAELGQRAARRALARIGAKKAPSAVVPMIVENRVAGRLFAMLLGPLSGSAFYQKRSFYEGKLGTLVASPLLTVTDDPLLPKGLGSRTFDGEGLTARRLPIVEAGVLRNAFIDTYYGRKTSLAPTTGGPSNLVFEAGGKSLDELVAAVPDGFLVTGFNGGNSNGTTGDFSIGINGYRIRKGERAEPVSEMNISANHLTFWKQLTALGNDPYAYSTLRTPSLCFESVQFAGT